MPETLELVVGITRSQYETFVRDLSNCKKPKHFRGQLIDKSGVRSTVLYDADRKIFYEKCSKRRIHVMSVDDESVPLSSEGALLLEALSHGDTAFHRCFEQIIASQA